MKKLMCLLLAALCLLGCAGQVFAAEGFVNFQKSAAYHTGLFYDVPEGEWFEESVGAVYDGAPGGTRNTLLYAREQGVRIVLLPIVE